MTIDWREGRCRLREPGPGFPWRITVASDWAPVREYEPLLLQDPEAIYGDLLPVLRRSDLCIVNVEAVLSMAGEPIPKSGPNLRGDERAVASLAAVPFHVACLANNHAMDFGPESLAHTISVLRRVGVNPVGAGLSSQEAACPLVIQAAGVRVGLVNCAEGEECRSVDGGPGVYGLDAVQVESQLRALRDQADVVLVIFHGGREYVPTPPPYVVNALRHIAACGADAVIAHHPHVPQGIEIYDGVPIAYSLGNFVFWQDSDLFYRRAGYLFHLDFTGSRLVGFEVTPYLLAPRGLTLMTGSIREAFLMDLEMVSQPLADWGAICAAWHAFIDRVGLSGLLGQLERSLKLLHAGDLRGAAVLKNLFFTPAHRELFVDGLVRVMRGEVGDTPAWAKRLVEQWFTLKYEERVARGRRSSG